MISPNDWRASGGPALNPLQIALRTTLRQRAVGAPQAYMAKRVHISPSVSCGAHPDVRL